MSFLIFEISLHCFKLLPASSAPAGAFFCLEKHVPGFWEHVLSGFCQFSLIWVSQGVLWADFGLPLALFGMPWGALGLPLAPFGPPWGPLWLLARKSLKIGRPGSPKVDFSIDVCSGIGGQEFIRGSRGSPGPRGSGVRSRSSDPPLHTRRSLRMT